MGWEWLLLADGSEPILLPIRPIHVAAMSLRDLLALMGLMCWRVNALDMDSLRCRDATAVVVRSKETYGQFIGMIVVAISLGSNNVIMA